MLWQLQFIGPIGGNFLEKKDAITFGGFELFECNNSPRGYGIKTTTSTKYKLKWQINPSYVLQSKDEPGKVGAAKVFIPVSYVMHLKETS